MFFNPMWSHFGDASQGPPGTYYKACSITDCMFWHLFDQVIYRHAASPLFNGDVPRIIQSDGSEQFCSTKGLPLRDRFSDHLPVIFELDV
jgi:hypothetical protein